MIRDIVMDKRQKQLLLTFVGAAKDNFDAFNFGDDPEAPTKAEVDTLYAVLDRASVHRKIYLGQTAHHLVDVFKGGNVVHASEADQVKVEVKRPYGSLVITVTDEGNVVFDSLDGDGEVLETACLNPDEYVCDGEADPAEGDLPAQLKTLDTVQQELKEAGIGQQPNPAHHEREGQEAGGQEEGRGQEKAGEVGEVGPSCGPGHPGEAGPRGDTAPGG